MTHSIAMTAAFLDVSKLPAPEPFQLILQHLSEMDISQYLIVTHRKQPLLLYKPLLQLDFNFHVQAGKNSAFDIIIWRKNDPSPIEITGKNLATVANDTPTTCGKN